MKIKSVTQEERRETHREKRTINEKNQSTNQEKREEKYS